MNRIFLIILSFLIIGCGTIQFEFDTKRESVKEEKESVDLTPGVYVINKQ